MDSVPIFFISIFLVLNHLIVLASSQEESLFHLCLSDNFTKNSIYSSNLNNLVSNFAYLKSNDYGFYNISVGRNPDRVNGLALCRGDVKPDACVTCIETAAKQLTDTCPRNKEAIIWYDSCMFRYSNNTILGKMESRNSFYMWNNQNVTDRVNFNLALRALLESLKTRAASGGSSKKYATGNTTGPAFQTIYGLTQCTPDLTEQDCNNCLDINFQNVPLCCDGRRGGRVIGASCNFRYETHLFYDPHADTGAAAPTLSASNSPPPQAQPHSEGALSVHGGSQAQGISPTIIIAKLFLWLLLYCLPFNQVFS